MYKALLIIFLPLFVAKLSHAQNWTDAEFRKANTAANASYLTDEEKNIVMYMNLIRIDGEKFYYTFLEDYINNYNAKVRKYRNYNELKITRTNPYYISLLKHMRGIKNLQMFYPDEKLTLVSRSHAQDLNRNNLGSHESSNGDTFAKRLSKYFPNKAMSENIDFGYSNSLDIVCHLLLDCGVPALGHRFNLLDQKYKLNTVGVSIQKHPSYTWCAVIDFVAQPLFYTNNQ
ncbi:CAP domain-containing protein [Pedobacter frigidisoli]|uniref:CAP domain-containing protein n=1 Tax=Pedobacter frigidisoli TaxID=2530455 RepID=A0A4R0P6L5_9SPHI|nr:CAP domain-containing protein [Pedobacter frigidisoli]TCD11122.1 CAP domain-containing protein [Pedobacter frigidisoli]